MRVNVGHVQGAIETIVTSVTAYGFFHVSILINRARS